MAARHLSQLSSCVDAIVPLMSDDTLGIAETLMGRLWRPLGISCCA